MPQLLLSVCSLTQPRPGPQYVSPEPVAHWQLNVAPFAAQVEPGPQTVPHVPQFGLALFEVHAPMHTIWPVGHAWHLPETQFSPAAHLLPQVPQLLGSVAVIVHTPGFWAVMPQITPLFGHAPHAPESHGAPVAHALPQPPQLFGSLISLAQTPRP
jgi:hypothetical protein